MTATFGKTLFTVTALTLASPTAFAQSTAPTALRAPECAEATARQWQDLRLAMKAQEGEAAFVRHVRFLRQYRQWTLEDALERARSAIRTPCGVALGLRPLDEARYPSLLARNP